ncbi:sulfite exporter TauE/SafE family protein, partial [Nonomuraea sp. NPDC059022]
VGIGSENINFAWVGVLLLGGVIAAPIAAWLVRHIPPRILGSAVGGVIILTNVRTLLRSDWIDAPGNVQAIAYVLIALLWVGAIVYSVREYRRDKANESVEAVDSELERQDEPTPA